MDEFEQDILVNLSVLSVESVWRTQDNIQHNMCLFNMATRESTRTQHALQANSLHNKYIYRHKPD